MSNASFRRQLAATIMEKGLTLNAYSRLIGHDSSGMVTQVLSGDRPFPLDDLDEWLRPLWLSRAARRSLRRLAYESYAKPHVLRLVNSVDQLDRWARKVAAQLEKLGVVIPPLPDPFDDRLPDPTDAPRPERQPSSR